MVPLTLRIRELERAVEIWRDQYYDLKEKHEALKYRYDDLADDWEPTTEELEETYRRLGVSIQKQKESQ